MDNTATETQDVVIGNHLGMKKMTIRVGMDSSNSVTLPPSVWNYGAIVNALIRDKYSESEVEAIISNSLLLMQDSSAVSEEDGTEKVSEFNTFQEYREKCKTRAKELLAIGEELGLKEM